ncbi:MAG: 4-oxalocrotonate tautomerase [Chloroflexi bacterium]|nr:4-oxalocrotonate tautomerase [Chloroflexota bacterium]
MPVVHIHMFEGRTDEQKSAVVKGVTEVLADAAGAPADATTVVIHETKRSNWAEGGVLASEAS